MSVKMANIADFLLDISMFMEVALVAAGIQKSEFEMDEGELRGVPLSSPASSMTSGESKLADTPCRGGGWR